MRRSVYCGSHVPESTPMIWRSWSTCQICRRWPMPTLCEVCRRRHAALVPRCPHCAQQVGPGGEGWPNPHTCARDFAWHQAAARTDYVPPMDLWMKRLKFAGDWPLAREMGRLDVGQSVAVKDLAVLAVEAIEGTDAAIIRAGSLCRSGRFTLVKVAKPKQDMRFDVPTVGVTTIQNLHRAGGKYLAIEAGKTILLNEAETLAIADQLGICIVALQDAQIGANDRKFAS